MVKEDKKEENISKQDRELLKEARELVELFKSKGYQEYLRPYLFTLAQEGYPKPIDIDKDGKKKYKNYEAMLPDYTFKCGETSGAKKAVEYIEGAEQTIKNINKKIDGKKDFQVGA